MNINETKFGFTLLSKKEMKDVGATFFEFKHQQSGASLLYAENEDTNCVFGIGFRTIPEDSTGVCHIIEHSLLCGSKKYPLKEPFINLVKGSLNTFLNAMTASDWTCYPVASQNSQDFDNLMAVYCDAVFAPLSIEDPKPFLQEGWHLELNSKEDIPLYKGVVYNEMKGATSDIDTILNQASSEALFPDNTYGFNSGGEPADIPNLTYEAYKDFYHRHYIPSNSLTFLYGKMDIEKKLEFLDREYFSHHEKGEKEITIPFQKPFINKSLEVSYALGEEEKTKDNAYFSLCYEICQAKDRKDFLAFQVLLDALLSTNSSPLKKALLDAKLGQDVEAFIDDDCLQPTLRVFLQKSNPSKKEEFEKVFLDSVKSLIKEGLDPKMLLASINSVEFSMREMDMGRAPKGLGVFFGALEDFVLNYDLTNSASFSGCFNEMRQELSSGYFESLLQKYIIESKHYVLVSALPSKTLAKQRQKAMEKKMKDLKKNMSNEEIEALVKQTKDLLVYQNKEDSPEDLATLPTLNKKDIPLDVNFLASKKAKKKGMKGCSHLLSTNGIGYLNLYFSEKTLSYEDLPYVSLLLELLGDVPTKSFDEASLSNEIKTYLGRLDFSSSVISSNSSSAQPYVVVSVSALSTNIAHISSLANEILLSSKFKGSKVKQALLQLIASTKQEIMARGDAVALNEAASSYSVEAAIKIKQDTSVSLYRFLTKLMENFSPKEVSRKLKEISKKLFTRYNVSFSISGEEEGLTLLKENLKGLKLPRKRYEEILSVPSFAPKKEAIVIPSGVSYNVMASNLSLFNLPFDGKYYVLKHIATFDYLWKEVRVKGGAYGTGLTVYPNGSIALTSFRDPNVENTYVAYDGLSDYLQNFKASKPVFSSYLVGALGSFDHPSSNRLFILEGDKDFFLGKNKKDKVQLKKQILRCTSKDIQECSVLFKDVKQNQSIVSVGEASHIESCSRFFKKESL